MRLLEGIEGLRQASLHGAVTIGNFDGVHLGHRALLDRCLQGRALTGGPVQVVTFEPHPLTVLRPASAPPRLTPHPIKSRLLTHAGVDELIILPPDRQVLSLDAAEFWSLLRDSLKPRRVVEGRNFRFGKGRTGDMAALARWCDRDAVELYVVEEVRTTLVDRLVVPVSSSLVRWLLHHGRVEDVRRCCGRGYVLAAPVVEGFRRGRTIGFPTANLRLDEQMPPGPGVYAAIATLPDGSRHAAALSVGTLPTFAEGILQVEAHLIGYEGDLYGVSLAVELVAWVRPQYWFPGVESLREQLARDVRRVRELLERFQPRPREIRS